MNAKWSVCVCVCECGGSFAIACNFSSEGRDFDPHSDRSFPTGCDGVSIM